MSEWGQSDHRFNALARSERIVFRVSFSVCFLLFLVEAVARRLTPWRKLAVDPHSGKHKSVFGEANTSARVCVASAFMGW